MTPGAIISCRLLFVVRLDVALISERGSQSEPYIGSHISALQEVVATTRSLR